MNPVVLAFAKSLRKTFKIGQNEGAWNQLVGMVDSFAGALAQAKLDEVTAPEPEPAPAPAPEPEPVDLFHAEDLTIDEDDNFEPIDDVAPED